MARRSALLLQIPQPCPEAWGAMTPTATGRHCASCEKVVVDFTRMTDGEVVAWLAKEGDKPGCGNFRPDQLNRPLFAAAQPAAAWQRWALALLALLGWRSTQPANAQTQGPPLPKSIQQGVAKPTGSNKPLKQTPASNSGAHREKGVASPALMPRQSDADSQLTSLRGDIDTVFVPRVDNVKQSQPSGQSWSLRRRRIKK